MGKKLNGKFSTNESLRQAFYGIYPPPRCDGSASALTSVSSSTTSSTLSLCESERTGARTGENGEEIEELMEPRPVGGNRVLVGLFEVILDSV
jgi:hypothetical protein